MKLKVDNDVLANEFFEGARLLGIVGPLKGYQFCWLVNHGMRVNFRLNPSLEISLIRKKRNYFFSVYEYQEPNGSLVHYLYNNQFDGEYLLPEFKHLDYLWLLKGDDVEDGLIQAMIQSVKQIPGVQLAMELSTDKIRNKEHLIF